MESHKVSIRDFLVYVAGQPVYINVLFAERNNIKEGSTIEKWMMDYHNRTVPEDMESDSSDYFMKGTVFKLPRKPK